MARQTCWYCGTAYDGFSCPTCEHRKNLELHRKELERISENETRQRASEDRHRAEEARSIQEAIEEAAADMEMAALEAAAQHKRDISQAWQLQAQSKSDRAHELLRAGMVLEAVRLSKEAIQQDPSNVEPYMCASWALSKKGDDAEAGRFYVKQIKLLDTPKYTHSPTIFESVLSGLPTTGSFRQDFFHSLRRNCIHWTESKALNLLDRLVNSGVLEEALYLTETLINRADSLMLQAYRLEILRLRGGFSTTKLSEYLTAISFERRSSVLNEYRGLANRSERFAVQTLNVIREEICKRYSLWKPDVENALAKSAIQQAQSDAGGGGFGCLGAIVGFCFFVIGVRLVVEAVPGYRIPLTEITPITATGGMLAAITLGLGAYLISRWVKKATSITKSIESLQKRENQEWSNLCSLNLAVLQPKVPVLGAIVVSSVLLVLVILGLLGASRYIIETLAVKIEEKPVASRPTRYGAIAYSYQSGKGGSSVDLPSREEAEARAISDCRVQDCVSVLWVGGGSWGAMAQAINNKIGLAWGRKRLEAESLALEECAKNGNQCRIIYVINASNLTRDVK